MVTQDGSSSATATARHSAVVTRRGLVCSPSPFASAAGVAVLRDGGNAFDAAIAAAAAECVTLPPLCGLGGELFALLYQASTGNLYGVTGSGRAPLAATREYFVAKGYEKMPLEGPLSASVPGEVHAWQTILERFGSRPLGKLVQPAVGLAEDGFPILPRIARYYTQHLDKLGRFPSTAALLTGGGQVLKAGHVLVQKGLANSLRRIVQGGAEEFYTGGLSHDLVDVIRSAGGLIAAEDLAQQTTTIYDAPPSTTYRGHTVFTNALPSQGYLMLELLNILEGYDLKGMGHNSPDAIHTMVEAVKMVFADRLAYVGDPEFIDVPMDQLLSKEFAEVRRRQIDPGLAGHGVEAGQLALAGDGGAHDTSYCCVVDAAGNAVSLIHSLSNAFGSGFVAGDTGIMLNNRVGRGFSLEAGHPNVVAPGKRTINTIHTYMAFGGDGSLIVGGTPGGDNQAQFNAQVLANLLDYGMNVQEAAGAVRWNHFPGTDPANVGRPYELRMEDGIAPATRAELERRGHRLTTMAATSVSGAVQVIRVEPDGGLRTGGADPRADGTPAAE